MNASNPPRRMLEGLRLGSAFGVEIRADWSVLVIFFIVMIDLGAGLFPRWHPDWTPALSWTVALAAAVLFFASILAHELAHALVARAQGISVRRVTLFLFGGIAHMETQPQKPMAEFAMAIVGPLTSAFIGVGALLLASATAAPALAAAMGGSDFLPEALARLGPLPTLLFWLGPVNLTLALFNLVPGFPLDGGRVLRSVVWGATGDLTKATRWAAGVGQLFAWLLMTLGVVNILHGGLAGGLWWVLIGWFLNNAARGSYQDLLVRQALHAVPVARVMRTEVRRVSPDLTLEAFVREHLMTSDQHAFPVEANGDLVGLVCIDDIRKVPQGRWADATVADVMTPASDLATLPADADAERALEELARRDVDQIPILEGHHFLGMVRRRDLMRWLMIQSGTPRFST